MNRPMAFLWAAVMVVAGAAGQASAYLECETDANCVEGFVCETIENEVCGPPAEPCEGDGCPEPDPVPCETQTFGMCVPGPCTTDADCGEGLQCLAVTYNACAVEQPEECFVPEECDPEPPVDPACEDVVEYMCLPPFMAPCETAADCGEGFECVADEICECSSGIPADPGDPAPEPECTCLPTGQSVCEPLEVECTDDTACVEGWTCGFFGDGDVACTFDPETGEEVCGDPAPVETGVCLPPYWEAYWFGADGEEGGIEAATGAENYRVDEPVPADSIGDGAGCNAAAATPGSAATFAWLIPLALLALARRR